MEQLFRKHFWVVQLGFAAATAILLAAGLNAFAASLLAPYSVALPETTEVEVAATAEEDEITDLPADLFGRQEEPEPVDLCATVQCAEGQICNAATGVCEIDPSVAQEEEVGDDGTCVVSDIALTLVGTQVAADPAWSLAVLRNPALNRTQFARPGATLLAEADVVRVERNRVIIRRNGREECIRFGDAATAAPYARGSSTSTVSPRSPVAAPSRPTVPATPGAVTASTDSAPVAATGNTIEERIQTGVRRNRDGSYDVDRSLVQEVANNQSLLEREAPRVVPNYVNGQPQGYRLQGIRSGSMFSRIGIRNGDVITRVGSTEIDSPQRALELYQQMMNQSSVTVTVLRRGREQTLTYNVR
jgi:general secretion pathway protein C